MKPTWLLAAAGVVPLAAALALLQPSAPEPRAGTDSAGTAERPAPATERPDLSRARLWRGEGFRYLVVHEGSRVQLYDRRGGRRVGTVGERTEFGSRTVLSVLRRKGEWLELTTPLSPDNRPLWARANRGTMSFGTTPLSLHVSLGRREVELRGNGKLQHTFPVTIGAAGSATPSGRYAVTDVIVGGLNPLVYGCCALALTARQPNLPEAWAGGDRVAIHGSSGGVGAASSLGCLRARDADVASLSRVVTAGVPVFIRA